MPFDDSVQVLAEDECLLLLNTREVGRITFEFKGRIEIFPVNYGVDGAVIVFRTSPGTKLEAVPKTAVAFEVDSWDPEIRHWLERDREGTCRGGDDQHRSRGRASPLGARASRRAWRALALACDQADRNHGAAIPCGAREARKTLVPLFSAPSPASITAIGGTTMVKIPMKRSLKKMSWRGEPARYLCASHSSPDSPDGT